MRGALSMPLQAVACPCKALPCAGQTQTCTGSTWHDNEPDAHQQHLQPICTKTCAVSAGTMQTHQNQQQAAAMQQHTRQPPRSSSSAASSHSTWRPQASAKTMMPSLRWQQWMWQAAAAGAALCGQHPTKRAHREHLRHMVGLDAGWCVSEVADTGLVVGISLQG